MNFFKRIKVAFLDVRNFFKFRKDISKEADWHLSKFNEFNLHMNKLKNIIFTTVNIPIDYELHAKDDMKFRYLLDLVKPINTYLANDLSWGEYLTCRFLHFEDSENPTTPVMTYQVEWKFTPYEVNRFSFWRNLFLGIAFICFAGFGISFLI